MPVFNYSAKKNPKEVIYGKLEAFDRKEAASKLSSQGLYVISLKAIESSSSTKAKVKPKELVEFTYQLSTLVNSSLPLVQSLALAAASLKQPFFKFILSDILSKVKEGKEFSYCLSLYPDVFPEFYIALVKVGEASGTLGLSLSRLAQLLEEELDFKANITSISAYPLLISAVGVVIIVVLLKFLIPSIAGIFRETGQTLPVPTQIMLSISDFFSKYWLIIFLAITAFFIGFKSYHSSLSRRLRFDKFLLELPKLGSLLKQIELNRFAQTFSILLKSGLAIDHSLAVLARTISNSFIRLEVDKIAQLVKEGVSLSRAVKKSPIFPAAFSNIISVGEESGRLASVLAQIADDYKKEINRKIKSFMIFLEPALILAVGLIVGFVVVAMLLPVFELDFNF